MDVSRSLMVATVAVPSTILTLSSVTSATNGLTDGDKRAARRALYVSGGVIAAGAFITGDVPLVLAVVVGVFTMLAVTYPHLDPMVTGEQS